MGYRVIYNHTLSQRETNKGLGFRVMVSGCFLLLTLSVRLFWPEGRGMMEHFLLPPEAGDVQTVLAEVVEDIRGGSSISEVVGAFFRDIIEDA